MVRLTFSFRTAFIGLALFLMAGFLRQDHICQRESFERFLQLKYRSLIADAILPDNGEPMPGHPEMARLQDYLETLDPATGVVPKQRLAGARQILIDRARRKNYYTDLVALEWEELPSNIGGRTRTLVFDPSDPDYKKVWAGSVTGGLWYNNDIYAASSSWEPVNDFFENLSISCIAFDPANPEIMYAGTGEAPTAVTIYRESSGVGQGLMKSEDGGQTWSPSNGQFVYVNDILIRTEGDLSVVYVAAASGVYQGRDHISQPSDGLYRSVDGGLTWEQVLPDIPGETVPYAPADIAMAANGRIFVGTQRNLDGEGASVILWSDDGTQWTAYQDIQAEISALADPARNIPGRVMLAASPSDSNRVYAVFASGGYNSALFILYSGYAFLKSEDNGATWEKMNMPSADGGWAYLAWHALTIEVDPNDPNTVFAGGLDQHKTSNGGLDWDRVSDWRGTFPEIYVHADQHKVVYKPGSSDTALFCTDGGVFLTRNGSVRYPVFEERNRNFNTIQYYTCDLHPGAGEEYFIAGTQDNGTYRYLGQTLGHEHFVSGGDGAYCFFDKNEPQYLITSYYYNRYLVFQSAVPDQLDELQYIDQYSGIFINPADYDSRHNTLYANAVTFDLQLQDYILRVEDVVTNPAGQFVYLNTGSTVPFSSVRYSQNSPADNTILFLGTQAGRLFKVEHAESGAPVVEEIGDSGFPTANISAISVGPSDDELLISFSNFGVPSIWMTHDGGATWVDVEGDLPDMPVRWIMHHPYLESSAIIATELGVWKTENLDGPNVTWVPNNQGLANVRVDMLRHRYSDHHIIAATHGRGLFVNRGVGLGIQPADGPAPLTLKLFPNPTGGLVHIDFESHGTYEMIISTLAGKILGVENGKHTGLKEAVFDLSHYPAGTYLIQVNTGQKKYAGKIIRK
jgi:hypothetical protein